MSPRVIDADGHVLEPMSAWETVPEAYRPEIVEGPEGLERVFVGGEEILRSRIGKLATPGARMSALDEHGAIAEALPGGYDPARRLEDMNREGIDAAVLYPSVGLTFWALRDAAAAAALARGYNDWLSGYCSRDRARLFGAAMVPMQDPAAGAAELRRAVQELGFKAAMIRPNPCRGRVISHPAHDVVWETAANLGVPIGIHEGTSLWIETLGAERRLNPFLLHSVSHAFESMLACGHLISDGVLERWPDLQIAFLESGGGWAPYWLERLDAHVRGFGGFCPKMKLTPGEYFQRQCWISFDAGERTLPALVPFIGEDRILWASDYPHHDATFPGATAELRKTIAPLAEPIQAKILGGNAARLYKL